MRYVRYLLPIQLFSPSGELMYDAACQMCGRGRESAKPWSMRHFASSIMLMDKSFGEPGAPTWHASGKLLEAIDMAEQEYNDQVKKDVLHPEVYIEIGEDVYERCMKALNSPQEATTNRIVYIQLRPFIIAFEKALEEEAYKALTDPVTEASPVPSEEQKAG